MRNFSTNANKRYARSFSTAVANNSSGYQYHQSNVNLNSVNLRLPYILSINAYGTQLTGQVTVDGEVIKRLESSSGRPWRAFSERINLSPYLSMGTNQVEILANYSPGSSPIRVEFVGPDTKIAQQTSGSGILRHTMTIIVS